VFHTGFWGATVGFYGGVNLGFGYGGSGFEGGRWQGPDFHYNRSLTHLGGLTTLKSYDQPVLAGTPSRVSYNGGPGGAKALATPRERAALWEHHLPPTAEQDRHLERASGHPGLLASVNRGNPPIAATERPGDFSPERSTPGKGPGGPVEEETLAANPRNLGRAIPGAVRPPEVMEEGFQLDGTRDGA
jgi:hypothetical protein